MAKQFVNQGAADVVKAAIAALGGDVSYPVLKARLEADGNAALVRDVLGLHLAGVIPGIVRAQPEGKPVLFLRSEPVPAAPTPSASSSTPVVKGQGL